MKIRNFDTELDFKVIPTIEKDAELLKTGHSQVIYMYLNPGDYIEKHSIGMDVSFFVTYGDLILN